jgi:NAD+ diphosphatase
MLRCSGCGFEYYHNAATAVAGIITNNKGEILLVKRAKEPGKGMLDLPGGFVDYGESAEKALRREIKEELCLKISSIKYLCSAANTYKYKEVTYSTVDLAFVCKVKCVSKAKPKDDVNSILFMSQNKIRIEMVAFKSIKKIIFFYFNNREIE